MTYLFKCNFKLTKWKKKKKMKKHSGSWCIKSKKKKLTNFKSTSRGYSKSFFRDKSDKEVKKNPPYQ